MESAINGETADLVTDGTNDAKDVLKSLKESTPDNVSDSNETTLVKENENIKFDTEADKDEKKHANKDDPLIELSVQDNCTLDPTKIAQVIKSPVTKTNEISEDKMFEKSFSDVKNNNLNTKNNDSNLHISSDSNAGSISDTKIIEIDSSTVKNDHSDIKGDDLLGSVEEKDNLTDNKSISSVKEAKDSLMDINTSENKTKDDLDLTFNSAIVDNNSNSQGSIDSTDASKPNIVDISDNSESNNSKDDPDLSNNLESIERTGGLKVINISDSSESSDSKETLNVCTEINENVEIDIACGVNSDKAVKILDKEVPLEKNKELINESDSPLHSQNEIPGTSNPPVDNKSQKLNLKMGPVQNLNSEADVEPSNFSSSSNKLNPSASPTHSEKLNKTSQPVGSESVNKQTPIYSDYDDESMSSVEKLSEESESMDCEEISLENSSMSNKKTDKVISDSNNHKEPQDLIEIDKNLQDDTENTACELKKKLVDGRSDNLVFAELSNEETGFPEMFTGLVKIGKYISVKGDFTLKSTEALVESPSLVASYLLKQPDKFPPKQQKDSKPELTRGFFQSSVGEFLIGIGISRVNQWFHRDMARIKKRQMKREGVKPELEEELKSHQKSFVEARKANSIFSFPCKTCSTCKFATESSIVMEGHLLVPHITPRREYQCNFCPTVNRDPRAMLSHMRCMHNKIGRIQPPVLFYECPYCMFESNSKVKLNSHLLRCQRIFNNRVNQAPAREFEFPAMTPKPITVAMVKNYERSMSSICRGRAKKSFPDGSQFSPQNVTIAPLPGLQSNQNILSNLQNQGINPMNNTMGLRPAFSNVTGQIRQAMPPLHLPSANRFYHVVNSSGQIVPMMGNSHLVTSPSQFPFSSNLVNTGQAKMQPQNASLLASLFGNGVRQQTPGKMSDLTGAAQLPKLQGPYPVQLSKVSTPLGSPSIQPSSLVVCEICDGYIKDLEQLRTHMQLIHKVKIHPKMLVSRPPLNCQKCQWRYFTDQGLERHLLGAHGLVTSNMQDMANKNKDTGCCTICGRVYASKLVSHMSQVHKVSLKPAHLSYKCTVCSATFSLYRLFENHVYLVHSGASKRPSDSNIGPAKKVFKSQEKSEKPQENSEEKADSPPGNSKTHSEQEKSRERDSRVFKCKDCGTETKVQPQDENKQVTASEKCEKCLKSDKLIEDVNSCKEELMKLDKTSEKVEN